MKIQLDNFDHKIIQALTDNARISITALSHLVNLSRNAVTNRMSKLEKSGFIKGYTTILGDGLTNSESVDAAIMVFRKDRMRNKEVIEYANKVPEIKSCYIMSGEYDIFLNLTASSQERIHEIWQDISNLKSVEDTNTVFVLSVTK
ncbi:MAG: Lrp/AsnC family transcriptional regulator [Planktomarina sp.]|jgi:DNA-binding Lrp family transcriptional regulator|nr:Lrp/AsnC family transcriptional regulator [Planktomarina sp.]